MFGSETLRNSLIGSAVIAALLAGMAGGPAAAATEEFETTGRYGSYLAGRFAERESDFASAADLLDRVIEERPDDPVLRQHAFFAHLRAGNLDRAVALSRGEDGRPISIALMTLAIDAINKEDWQEAVRLGSQIDISGLFRYSVPLTLAWSEAGRGDVDAAITSLSALSDVGGFARLRSLHEALIYASADRFDEAILAINPDGGDMAEAPITTVRTLASLHMRKGDPASAIALLQGYLAVNAGITQVESDLAKIEAGETPLELLTPGEGIAEGFYHLASGVRQQADDLALIYARLSTFLDPDFDLPNILLASILEGRKRHAEAIDTLQRITPDSDYHWEARLSIADNLEELARIDEAITLLEEMSAEREELTDPLIKLGYIYRADKRYLDEVEVYNRAIGRVGEELEQRHWLLFYNRGIAYERSKQWPKAEVDFLKALELKPDDPFVLNYLGYSWVEQGVNIGEAKEMIRTAVKQRQSDGYIVDSLGWVLYRIGEFEEAVAYLERAVQLRPEDPIINDHLGDAYWRVGRKVEARFQWDRALNLDPEDNIVETIREKLREGLGEPEIISIEN